MAKKKDFMDEQAAVIEEETLVPSIKEEEVQPQAVKEDDVDVFIREQLKVINNMGDTAKARRLATRVLRNKRKG